MLSYLLEVKDLDLKSSSTSLETPLAQWVEQNIVDPLTDGRSALLREAGLQLNYPHRPLPQDERGQQSDVAVSIAHQIHVSLHSYPPAMQALGTLQQIRTHKIDMAALIREPGELFLSEEEWAGKDRKATASEGRNVKEEASDSLNHDPIEKESQYQLESEDVLNHVLDYAAGVIGDVDKRIRAEGIKDVVREVKKVEHSDSSSTTPSSHGDFSLEDPALRNLRLNLLALAKRAPLDTIARLPKDLVPEHIRHFVPTLYS